MGKIDDILNLFEDIAKATSDKYLAEVKILATMKGSRPGFDELMPILSNLERELTKQAVSILERQNNAGENHSELTNGLNNIIKGSIEKFIKQL